MVLGVAAGVLYYWRKNSNHDEHSQPSYLQIADRRINNSRDKDKQITICVGSSQAVTVEMMTDVSNFNRFVQLPIKASSVRISSLSGAGGLSAEMNRLHVQLEDSNDKNNANVCSFVLKSTQTSSNDRSIALGLAREGVFYDQLAGQLRSVGVSIPQCYFAYADMGTGSKVIVLEDLGPKSIQAGYFFGNGSPHNWGKNLTQICSAAPNVSAVSISKSAFAMAASMHALYWKDIQKVTLKSVSAAISEVKSAVTSSECDRSWLRGYDWIRGEGEGSFHEAQQQAIDNWKVTKTKFGTQEYKVVWDQLTIDCIESSFSKVSWSSFQQELTQRPVTLVHGDFHPANMMYIPADAASTQSKTPSASLYLLDWEVIGVGSGPQDIAQFLISHMDAPTRKQHEHELIQYYYDALIQAGGGKVCDMKGKTYSLADCKEEYIRGGSERWIWLLALISNMCPDSMVQYFHDQLTSFIRMHGVTASSIGQPRV